METNQTKNIYTEIFQHSCCKSVDLPLNSPVLEVRLSLLDECLETLLAVLETPRRVEEVALEPKPVVERHLLGSVDAFLGELHHGRREGRDLLSDLHSLVQGLSCRHDAGHQSGSLSLRSADHVAGQNPLHSLGLADSPYEALSASHARDGTQLDFRLAELRILGRNDDVATHGELAATAQGEAVDGRDDGLACVGDAGPMRQHVAVPHFRITFAGVHLLDVRPGGEGLADARDHDCPDGVVCVDFLQLFHQLLHERVRKRIQSLGTVQREHSDLRRPALQKDEVLRGRRECPWHSSPQGQRAHRSAGPADSVAEELLHHLPFVLLVANQALKPREGYGRGAG
mmetsp:Transcript_180248/g.572048  ORF Transcript_180248/g.572048 Transcript_180248/m.572048 type:complete len:343 (+) Transcript_180248:207-1235(+)